MPGIETIDIGTARRLVLAAQGLSRKQPFGTKKAGVLATIEHLGYVQIDTISVVERAHLHCLWSRTGEHSKDSLHRLQLSDRKVFEYWAHAAAYLPMQNFRHALVLMEHMQKSHNPWYLDNAKLRKQLLARVQKEGALQARDFAAPPSYQAGTWWDFKPAKRMLQALFMRGELMISHRVGFEKVYDLPERVLPATANIKMPDLDAQASHIIFSTLQAQGLAAQEDVTYPLRISGQLKSSPLLRTIDELLHALTDSGELVQVAVAGKAAWLTPASLESKARLSPTVHILSPFDNLIIQRKRLRWLFNYDYRVECYLPAEKRRFGYFCLPLLQAGHFFGCMDAKADRKLHCLYILMLHLQADIVPTASLVQRLASALHRFARFNQCEVIKIMHTQPASFRKKLQRALTG